MIDKESLKNFIEQFYEVANRLLISLPEDDGRRKKLQSVIDTLDGVGDKLTKGQITIETQEGLTSHQELTPPQEAELDRVNIMLAVARLDESIETLETNLNLFSGKQQEVLKQEIDKYHSMNAQHTADTVLDEDEVKHPHP